MTTGMKAGLALGAAAVAFTASLTWYGGRGSGHGPAPRRCICADADGSGAPDDGLWCVEAAATRDAGDPATCIPLDALSPEEAARLESCVDAPADVRLDHEGCGGDRDGSSPGCEGGAPDGSCSAEEDERSCLADCGCFARTDLCGPFEEVGACPTDTCCCDDGCQEKGDCCPDASAACGVRP